MTIPNIELVLTVDTPAAGAGTTAVLAGAISDSALGWTDIGLYGATEVYDIYEDGAPMADGRVFQASCYTDGMSLPTTGPTYFIPPNWDGYSRINVPIVYVRDTAGLTDIMTCFGHGPADPASRAMFFHGAFYVGGVDGMDSMSGCKIPACLIPVLIQPGAAGTGFENQNSSTTSFCLAHGYSNGGHPTITPTTTNKIDMPPYVVSEERGPMQFFTNTTSGFGGGGGGFNNSMDAAIYTQFIVDTSNQRAFPADSGPVFAGGVGGSPRHYRRADTDQGTGYDWTGTYFD